jgi:hypothetical protein
MRKVISIHEYLLKPEVSPDQFEDAVREAQRRGLLTLPGLLGYPFVRGIKGPRTLRFSAIRVYESRNAWEASLISRQPVTGSCNSFSGLRLHPP